MNYSEIKSAASELISIAKSASNGDPIKEKKIAIAENIIRMTQDVVDVAKLCSKKKRIFQPKNRVPKHKIEKRKKIFQKIIAIQSAKIRHRIIMQTPIPRYKLGSGTLTTIGERGPEIVDLSSLR